MIFKHIFDQQSARSSSIPSGLFPAYWNVSHESQREFHILMPLHLPIFLTPCMSLQMNLAVHSRELRPDHLSNPMLFFLPAKSDEHPLLSTIENKLKMSTNRQECKIQLDKIDRRPKPIYTATIEIF